MEEQHGIASNSNVLIQMKILNLQPISVAVGISVLLSLLSHAAVTVSSRILSHIDKSNHQPIINALGIKAQLLPIRHCFSCNPPCMAQEFTAIPRDHHTSIHIGPLRLLGGLHSNFNHSSRTLLCQSCFDWWVIVCLLLAVNGHGSSCSS